MIQRAIGVARRQISKRLPPLRRKISFTHIPKCAGMSVAGAMAKTLWARTQTTFPAVANFDAIQTSLNQPDIESFEKYWLRHREIALLSLLDQGYELVKGHLVFSQKAHEKHADEYAFVTTLREPVSRFVSNFLHNYQTHGGPHLTMRSKERLDYVGTEQLMQFLETDEAVWQARAMLIPLAGPDQNGEFEIESALERAKENLKHRFDVVGLVGELDRFRDSCKEKLGLSLKVGLKNKIRINKGSSKSIVDDAARRKLEELCGHEIELFEFAQTLQR